MDPTVPLRVRRLREVLRVADDALLEAYATGQASVMQAVAAPAPRRVHMHNVNFYMIHGWTTIVLLQEVECGLPISLPSPPMLIGDAES
jgi:hypothetical protein